MTKTFTLSIETDAGTYQHGFHLGTDEGVARKFVEDAFGHLIPKIGTRVITLGLKRDCELFDVFDGAWSSDLDADFYLEGAAA